MTSWRSGCLKPAAHNSHLRQSLITSHHHPTHTGAPSPNATFFCDSKGALCYALRGLTLATTANYSSAEMACGAVNGTLVEYDSSRAQAVVEAYFRGANGGGWALLPASYWMGVSRIDSTDTWKLSSGLEVGQVSGRWGGEGGC